MTRLDSTRGGRRERENPVRVKSFTQPGDKKAMKRPKEKNGHKSPFGVLSKTDNASAEENKKKREGWDCRAKGASNKMRPKPFEPTDRLPGNRLATCRPGH